MTDPLLQQVLDALTIKADVTLWATDEDRQTVRRTIAALRERLAQKDAEPVAEVMQHPDGYLYQKWFQADPTTAFPKGTRFYAAPPAQPAPRNVTEDDAALRSAARRGAKLVDSGRIAQPGQEPVALLERLRSAAHWQLVEGNGDDATHRALQEAIGWLERINAAPPAPAGMALVPIPGLIWAVALKEKNKVYAMFDTPEQANAFVEALKAPLEAAELEAKETPARKASADFDLPAPNDNFEETP